MQKYIKESLFEEQTYDLNPIRAKAIERYRKWAEKGGGYYDFVDDKWTMMNIVEPGNYEVVETDMGGMRNDYIANIKVISPIDVVELAYQFAQKTGYINPWGYFQLRKTDENIKTNNIFPLDPELFNENKKESNMKQYVIESLFKQGKEKEVKKLDLATNDVNAKPKPQIKKPIKEDPKEVERDIIKKFYAKYLAGGKYKPMQSTAKLFKFQIIKDNVHFWFIVEFNLLPDKSFNPKTCIVRIKKYVNTKLTNQIVRDINDEKFNNSLIKLINQYYKKPEKKDIRKEFLERKNEIIRPSINEKKNLNEQYRYKDLEKYEDFLDQIDEEFDNACKYADEFKSGGFKRWEASFNEYIRNQIPGLKDFPHQYSIYQWYNEYQPQ